MAVKKFTKANVAKAEKIINKHRLVKKRVTELEDKGFEVVTRAMGSGGKGQIKKGKRYVYLQVGYGTGKWNHAKAVQFSY